MFLREKIINKVNYEIKFNFQGQIPIIKPSRVWVLDLWKLRSKKPMLIYIGLSIGLIYRNFTKIFSIEILKKGYYVFNTRFVELARRRTPSWPGLLNGECTYCVILHRLYRLCFVNLKSKSRPERSHFALSETRSNDSNEKSLKKLNVFTQVPR